jgi:hypothetical protein
MPNLFQRFARARDTAGGEDPPQRPKTSADELTSTADVIPGPKPQPDEMPVTRTDNDTSADSKDADGQIHSVSIDGRKTADPDQVRVDAEGNAAESEQQQAVDPVAAAAVAAELKKASQKARAAAALKKMKARSGFSLWRWLPTFYDPVEDTIRSRIIAVLAVAVIPAMLTGLLLEPMITDVAAVTQNKAIIFSPLFLPMDPMYVGVLSAQGYEFRFVVRNAKNWPKSGNLSTYLDLSHIATPLTSTARGYHLCVYTAQLHGAQPRFAAALARLRSCARWNCAPHAGRRLYRRFGGQHRKN